ncbi:NfrA family protein [Rouxiella sp. Mn2063]|uniref:NfrA family protein n=1 Tax=Rouxiella sp. Mn2063 TaxID=3395262 RepID=UPI003BD23454
MRLRNDLRKNVRQNKCNAPRPRRHKRGEGIFKKLVLGSLLFSPLLQAAQQPEAVLNLGLSEYRTFVIYPHLQRAMGAMHNEQRDMALKEFARAHELAPENPQLSLYLAEAYRHFGEPDKARQVLEAQWHITPDNTKVRDALLAIPLRVESPDDLNKLDQFCQIKPTDACRTNVGDYALSFDQYDLALRQLDNEGFSQSPSGIALRRAIIQRAIGNRHYDLADQQFERLNQLTPLNPNEQQQWFGLLLSHQQDARLLALQHDGKLNSPEQQLAYAQDLARRGQKQSLADYLAQRQPLFSQAPQERDWLYLLATAASQPANALASYKLRFPENQQYIADAQWPLLLANHDDVGLQRLLDTLPADSHLSMRMALSLRQKQGAQSAMLAQQMMAARPQDWQQLDVLSYQLGEIGQSAAATQLLLNGWPYSGAAMTLRQRLTQRLASGLHDNPALLTSAVRERLQAPLSTPALRSLQLALLQNLGGSCQQIQTLMGDLSTAYPASDWSQLANCYHTQLPGLAMYAWQQAVVRDPSADNLRGMAYQAYAVEDFAAAVRLWLRVPEAQRSASDEMALANSALAANDWSTLASALENLRQHQADRGENYWWLQAQWQQHQGDRPATLNALNQAIAAQPTARALVLRGQMQLAQGELRSAIATLQQAITLDSKDASTHAALGFALFDDKRFAAARDQLELAHQQMPDQPQVVRQLVYVNQRLDDTEQTRRYSELAVDMLDDSGDTSKEAAETRFALRRLHEQNDRRWSFGLDAFSGSNANAPASSTTSAAGGNSQQSYRSYGQFEAAYKIGDNQWIDGDTLAAYGRLFAGGNTGSGGGSKNGSWPIYDPMVGLGLRWKPLREQVFYLAAEQQVPLDRHRGSADVMLRASASFLNSGRFSDEWHPDGPGWVAQNLYLDSAYYIKNRQQAYTADYRLSWHQKIKQGQTLEPYAHLQWNESVFSGNRDSQNTPFDGNTSHNVLGGVGMRWNIWSGETRYDAWPHKISVGLEYQHVFDSRASATNGTSYKDSVILSFGGRW